MKTKSIILKASYAIALALPLAITSCMGNSTVKNDLKKFLAEEEAKKHAVQSVSSDSLEIDMEIPQSMIATTSLDAGVPFQYMDGTQELYVIGNREDKEIAKLSLQYMEKFDEKVSMSENYMNYTIDLMKETGNEITVVKKISKIKSKNVSGVMMQIDGKLPSIVYPISYWLTCYEYKGNVYKFIFWTLQSKKADVEKQAMKTLESIKFK